MRCSIDVCLQLHENNMAANEYDSTMQFSSGSVVFSVQNVLFRVSNCYGTPILSFNLGYSIRFQKPYSNNIARLSRLCLTSVTLKKIL